MYLVDSDVLITAANLHYPFDVFPGLWEWLEELFAMGELGSVDMVRQEIASAGDALSDWVDLRKDHFLQPDGYSAPHISAVADWVWSPGLRYKPAARASFLAGADHQLVALAIQHGAVVVTGEKSAPDSKASVKIPDACDALDVECIGFPQFLMRLRPRFVLPQ